MLHPADPFLETAGEDIRRRMFVTEGPAGERLALRPDFTIPVCLEHLKNGTGARRYAYEGLVFRRHDSGAPERRETGCEDIGQADPVTADADMLALAVAAASTLVAGPLSVRIGDIGLFAALLRALGLPGRWRRRLRRSFGVPNMMATQLEKLSTPRAGSDPRLDAELSAAADAHDRGALVALVVQRAERHGLAEGGGRSPEEIAERFLDQRALAETHIDARALDTLRSFLELRAPLGKAADALASFAGEHRLDLTDPLENFGARADAIAGRAPPADISFEASFGRPLDYYTGLVFEVRAEGLGAPLAGGGRYDRLLEMLGAERRIPAVGFTMRLDLIGSSL